MNFNLTDAQRDWQSRASALAGALPARPPAHAVIRAAAEAGLLDAQTDLLGCVVAVQELARSSATAAVALALHWSVAAQDDSGGLQLASVRQGSQVGAVALSSDDVPYEKGGRLSGTASWVAPLTPGGLAVVGARSDAGLLAGAVRLDAPGVTQDVVGTAALPGLVCGHLRFSRVPCEVLGPTEPFMVRARMLLAAAGLGMGHRALQESLSAAHGRTGHGAAGEQTVQGLLADAATELDAATLLTWTAAAATTPTLGGASKAKLAATDAAQRAVARATQVVGADSFCRGHIIEQLAQDVRALELFAGRTEALRESVALEELPR